MCAWDLLRGADRSQARHFETRGGLHMINRRTFGKTLGLSAGGAVAATLAGPSGPAQASAVTGQRAATAAAPAAGNRGRTAFPSLKQVRAGLLEIGYAELGPARGTPVICLHGWPYDIHSFVDVAPLLAAEGYRAIIPYLRGHGTTRFISPRTFRNGQQSALALDIIALMDALGLEKAVLAGFDWGARTADVIAALWPERCKALVSVGGYLVINLEANLQPLPCGDRARLVVPVLLLHGAGPDRHGGQDQAARPDATGLGHRLPDLGLRRRHLRAHGRRLREPGLRRHRDPQLPLAAEPRRR
ncbi:hypothetical protein GCM10020000_03290 [Streptomyces olivoverticillatus]